jgi:hypothetical protein
VLARADVLCTKPSEMVFYAGLGLPPLLTKPIDIHENYNLRFARENGAALEQRDPRTIGERLQELSTTATSPPQPGPAIAGYRTWACIASSIGLASGRVTRPSRPAGKAVGAPLARVAPHERAPLRVFACYLGGSTTSAACVRMMNCTRRLRARLCGVSLPAIGWSGP